MRIVLSRKGFDSSAGGHASPVLPDGTMLSLPIPSSLDHLRYRALRLPGGVRYDRVIAELDARARIDGKGAHLDPDLVRSTRARRRGWRPSLGQIGAAAGHLRNQQIGTGDLFLFYGWFRHARTISGRLSFTSGASGFHAVYGYLQVGEIIHASGDTRLPAWLGEHPHAASRRMAKSTNTLYIAAERLGGRPGCPGAGAFRFNESLVLTKPHLSRSRWALDPALFRHVSISYHTARAWRDGYFQSYPRAQEYVVHADPPVVDWAYGLISSSERWS